MTMRRVAFTTVVSGLLLSVVDVAVGQQVSIGGSTGSGATSGSGSGRTTGSSTTSAGSQSTTSRATTGSSATTGSGTSNSAAAGTTANGTSENVANSAQNFIGGNALDTFIGGGLESAVSTNRNRQFRAVTETGTEGLSQAPQQQGAPRSRTVALRVGFPVSSIVASSSQLSAENSVSLESFVSVRPEFRAISVSVSADGRVTLVGTTGTSESRRLAANLLRLQPGVRRVDNQIVVTGN